jgi:superfamily II DNA or RNA helicase
MPVPLNDQQRDILTVLALTEPLNITRFVEFVTQAGIRESSTRDFSTKTLRASLEAPIAIRYVFDDGQLFRLAPSIKHPALRLAAARGRLAFIAEAIADSVFRSSWRYRHALTRELDPQETAFWCNVALAQSSTDLDLKLDAAILAAVSVEQFGQRHIIPALVPFDREWFAGLPEAVQVRLLWLAGRSAEVSGQSLGDAYHHALAHPRLVTALPQSHSSLFALALYRGDFAGASKLASLATGALAPVLATALDVVRGGEPSNPVFVAPKKDEPIGAARLLQGLFLLARGGKEDVLAAKRIGTAGSRKTVPFRQSAAVLQEMAIDTLEPGRVRSLSELKKSLDPEPENDCLAALFEGIFALWFKRSLRGELAIERCRAFGPMYGGVGQSWLADQYAACADKLTQIWPPRGAAGRSTPARSGADRPLYELLATKERWQLDLEALERLAHSAPTAAEAAEVSDDARVLWRVHPWTNHIEPYLQTRKGSGYTSGRKLAVKHLLHGSKELPRLPREDRAVAAFAREHREMRSGYPTIYHTLEPRAWLALVGHPRVEHLDTQLPVEIVRGAIQVVAKPSQSGLLVRLEPNDLESDFELREEGSRIVVYAIEPAMGPIRAVLGAGLEFPKGAETRAFAALGRLSAVVSVQSTVRAEARTVQADPKPWLRIRPRGAGLSVSAFVRPLGNPGPEVEPGAGARLLMAHREGESLQAERDLGLEREHLSRFIERCPLLDGLCTHRDHVVLEEVAACLELVGALQQPDCPVHAEWPEGKPLRLRRRVGFPDFRGRIQHGAEYFFASGELSVEGDLSLKLEELLELLSRSPGRFVRLGDGDYLELERNLVEALNALATARVAQPKKTAGIAVPRLAFAALRLGDEGFSLDVETTQYRDALLTAFAKVPKVPAALQAELRDYQLDGFRWLARLGEAGLGGCLADDMGLGKTVQAIALLLQRGKTGPALVVAPTSVCENWRRELVRFGPSLAVRVYAGPNRKPLLKKLPQRTVVITSYALLQQDIAALEPVEWGTVILDEAQHIKNAESQRAQAAYSLRSAARFALTGTPVENHLGDLYGIFRFLAPDFVGSWQSFARRFPVTDEQTGQAARRALRQLLKPFLLRRTKAQVLEELPPLTEMVHTVTLSAAEVALYERVRQRALLALKNAGGTKRAQARFQVLAEITRLRRLCCHPKLEAPDAPLSSSKLEAAMGLLRELRQGGHRALVFSQFVDVLSLLREQLDGEAWQYQYLDGSTPASKRTAAVDAFQSGEGDVFLISLKAGGFGLNLTAADYVIHLDPWWNPAVEAQASDRVHRIGQSRPVTVYRLIASGTIEERIVELHKRKRELADSLLEEGHRAANLGPDELRALLEAYALAPGVGDGIDA